MVFRLALVLSLLVTLFSPRAALGGEPSKAECAEAYEKGQEYRASGKLGSAHEAFGICGHESCPSFIQADCAKWAGQVADEMPSIVVAAKDPGGYDTIAVRVFMDDQQLLEQLDGTPIGVDAGDHEFRFEMDGAEPVTMELSISEGQRNEFIEIEFESDGSAKAAKKSKAAASPVPEEDELADEEPTEEPPAEDTAGQPGPLRPYAYVAGGVGVASLIGFAITGAMGKSEVSDMRDGCSQTPEGCTQDAVDAAQTKLLLADVFLGVGIAGLGTGVVLFFLSQPSDSTEGGVGSLRVGVSPAPSGGGFARVSGRF